MDPFMHRLKELEDLKEETVLWEIYKDDKAKQGAEGVSPGKGWSQKISRQGSNGTPSCRSQSAKVNAPQLYRSKSAVNRLKRSSSAGRTNSSNHAISVSDDGSDSVRTFRNSGYQLGISFVPGSLYPEARPPPKTRTRTPNSKSSNSETNSKKNVTGSGSQTVNTQVSDDSKKSPSPKCEACTPRPECTSPRSVATSVRALRNQYALKASECYDIVELARTFDPPCKNHFVKAAKAKLVTSNSLVFS